VTGTPESGTVVQQPASQETPAAPESAEEPASGTVAVQPGVGPDVSAPCEGAIGVDGVALTPCKHVPVPSADELSETPTPAPDVLTSEPIPIPPPAKPKASSIYRTTLEP
jgi:hypothetical protein